MSAIGPEARIELVGAIADRYKRSCKGEKARILDEFVRITGYHRKHAIRVLGRDARVGAPEARARPRVYDEAVRQALVVLWEASSQSPATNHRHR